MKKTTVNPDQACIVIDLYCRISKDYDGTLRSVEAQEEQGRAWVEAHAHLGYVLGKIHRDHALSGWNPKVVREEWLALMDRLENGEAGGVWVRDLDRFTRKLSEAERLLELVESRGVVVVAGHSQYDLTTARGRRAFREDAVDAAYESDRISERTTRGKRQKVQRGKSNASRRGFARPGFLPVSEGWEPGDPRVEVPTDQLAREVAAVRDAAQRLLAGDTINAICREWNEAGLLTVNGKLWDSQLFRQLFAAPSLAGLLEHKGQIVGELAGEPVLDRATWERVLAFFASRRRGRPATSYLLSGIIRCGRCGSELYGRPKTNGTPYPDGEVRRQYYCQPRANRPDRCGALVVDQRFADAVVEAAVLERLGDPRHADRVAKVAARMEDTRRELVAELSRLEESADALAEKVLTWGMERVEKSMAPIEARMVEVRDQLSALELPDTTATVDAAQEWKDATLEQRRAMVRRAFPEGITVKPSTSRGRGARKDVARFVFGREESETEGAA